MAAQAEGKARRNCKWEVFNNFIPNGLPVALNNQPPVASFNSLYGRLQLHYKPNIQPYHSLKKGNDEIIVGKITNIDTGDLRKKSNGE